MVAAALRVYALGDQSLWYDEWDTAFMSQSSFGDMLSRLGPVELSPPVYFVVTWLWAVPFGDSEFALRSVSAIAGVATVWVLYLAGRDLFSRRAGLIVAWLAAVNPLLVWYSQEARSYSLMLLFTAAAFLFFVRAMKQPERARSQLYLWGAASALAMATHYLTAVLIVPEAALLWISARVPRRPLLGALAIPTVTGLALLPLLANQVGHGSWISELPLRPRAEGVFENMAIGFYSPFGVLPWIVVAGLAVAVVVAWRGGREERHGLFVSGGVGLVAAALLIGPIVIGQDYVITRNLIQLWVPFGVAAGVALAAPRLGRAGPAATAVLAAVSIALVFWVASDPKLQRPDWEDLAEQVPPATQERLWVAMADRGYNQRPLSLYIGPSRGLENGPQRLVAVREVVIARTKAIESHALGTCFWGALCNGNSGGYPFELSRRFRLVQKGETDRFEFERYVARKPSKVPKFNGRGRYVESPAD